jgi:hypothetical protein
MQTSDFMGRPHAHRTRPSCPRWRGRRPRARTMDLPIAATAHVHEARLYTRNPADLVGADELVGVIAV